MPLRLELEIFTYAKVIERTAVPEKSGRAVFSCNRKFYWNFLLHCYIKKPDQAESLFQTRYRKIDYRWRILQAGFFYMCVSTQHSKTKECGFVLENNEKPQQSKQNFNQRNKNGVELC